MSSQAIKILEHEHRIIEQVLASLEGFVDQMEQGEEVGREPIRRYAGFFTHFADRCHHGKEEDLLFKLMQEHGFSDRSGPVAVMLAEHTAGRAHVSAIAQIGAGQGELSDEECDALADHASSYIPMLRNHIGKEDGILYVMAERTIPEARMSALAEEFERFEQERMGDGEHQRLHALAGLILTEYPPLQPGAESCAACGGCGVAGGSEALW